jgi:ElaB/YqjD/DUF883 family membrane-anchored ribosome-binding protein
MDDGCITLYDADRNCNSEIYCTESLDDLLEKLIELTASDAKNDLEKRFIKIESKLSELSISMNAIKSLITTKTKE